MRPCFFINDFQKGGAERLVKDLAIEMVDQSVAEPVVIVARNEGELRCEFERSEIPVHGLEANISPRGIPRATVALSGLLSELEVDLVHSHLPFAHVVSRLACARHGVPHIATYHNVREHKTRPKRLAERVTSRLSDCIVCVSEGVRNSYPGSKRTRVIYNAIDVEDFHRRVEAANPSELKASHDGKLILLNVARCVEQKRQEDLIEAISLLESENIQLYIVGDGPRRRRLEEIAREKEVSNQVTITGYVDEIEPYFAMADIFVSSSANEGLPTTHIEAMAAELPIISTDIPGIREIVIDGENGYLTPVGDLRELAENIKSLENLPELGKSGFSMASQTFSIDRIVRQHCALYTDLVEK